MAITDTLDVQQETKEQIESALHARYILETWTRETGEKHDALMFPYNDNRLIWRA